VGIIQRDYPVVQGFVLYLALVFLSVNLLVDLAYRWVDPRLHFESS
jgi:peptide/nickel transport system permease protein